MDLHVSLVQNIVKAQKAVIGPVAIDAASTVEGLHVDPTTFAVTFKNDNKKEIVERLVQKYENLFGEISVQVCKESVNYLVTQESKSQIPQILL